MLCGCTINDGSEEAGKYPETSESLQCTFLLLMTCSNKYSLIFVTEERRPGLTLY